MHLDDATAFIIDFMRHPRNDGYGTYGYELYLPIIVTAYIREIEGCTDHRSSIHNSSHAADLSPLFYEAAWNLCRQGILRPGIRRLGTQATDDGASGNGYSITSLGRAWLASDEPEPLLFEPTRIGELFRTLAQRLGIGFLQRAIEASRCHSFGGHLACCAMCGAAVESVLLAIAIARIGDEAEVLRNYRSSQGRRWLLNSITGNARQPVAERVRAAADLLSYWRDEAAHGTASSISEAEAHQALTRLLRFAQFANDSWQELTT
jgi:hypothetical protein